MASELDNKIIRQIEYYFGDINLPRDRFLQEKLKDGNGWISLEELLAFKKLASLSKDLEVIALAVEKAENGLLELSEDRKKIRRNPNLPVPEWNEARRKELEERTAYIKGFPIDELFNDIIAFLDANCGQFESCKRRFTKDNKFKGSCFVIFKEKEACKEFIERESLKYKDVALIRKWQNDFFAEKKREYEERLKAKKEKNEAMIWRNVKQVQLPKGATIYFLIFPEFKQLTREVIKEKVYEIDSSLMISFVNFNRGDTEGYFRFSTENAAIQFLRKLSSNELQIGDAILKLKVLEGGEEEDYLKKTTRIVTILRAKAKAAKERKRKRLQKLRAKAMYREFFYVNVGGYIY